MLASFLGAWIAPVGAAEITLIHMGDVHGHLMPRPSIRGETSARTEGGLARMYTKISKIRAERSSDKTLLLNTGDTIQGSAEALFTKGQALVDVLNRFAIDAYAPGNWDWVYGVERALELFAGPTAKAPWHALAANAYYESEPYADRAGSRVLPPYLIREIDGVKIGILGFTSDRGSSRSGRRSRRAPSRASSSRRSSKTPSTVRSIPTCQNGPAGGCSISAACGRRSIHTRRPVSGRETFSLPTT
jgi:hypothetical protein